MPNLYVTAAQLKLFGIAPESDDDDVFDLLADSVSRMFDRECEVTDGFFNAASGAVSRSYRSNGTEYVKLFPYIADSITVINVDGTEYYTATVADRLYRESENYLIFDEPIEADTLISVTANYGFSAVSAAIQMACIEQALTMWRRKDMAFAEVSGVSAAVVNAEFSPTFASTVQRFRELYSANNYFA